MKVLWLIPPCLQMLNNLCHGGKDGTVRLWKLLIAATTMPGHSAPVRCVVSAASGQWSATY
ncbi:MAG: hypothetical protein U0936_06915 [Planctomycetaceae bacterium]